MIDEKSGCMWMYVRVRVCVYRLDVCACMCVFCMRTGMRGDSDINRDARCLEKNQHFTPVRAGSVLELDVSLSSGSFHRTSEKRQENTVQ